MDFLELAAHKWWGRKTIMNSGGRSSAAEGKSVNKEGVEQQARFLLTLLRAVKEGVPAGSPSPKAGWAVGVTWKDCGFWFSVNFG